MKNKHKNIIQIKNGYSIEKKELENLIIELEKDIKITKIINNKRLNNELKAYLFICKNYTNII